VKKNEPVRTPDIYNDPNQLIEEEKVPGNMKTMIDKMEKLMDKDTNS
jgi:hypothetical protein